LWHLLVFSFVINFLMLSLPVLMIQIFDRVLVSHSIPTLWVLTLGAFGAIGVMAGMDFIRARLATRVALNFGSDVRQSLFDNDKLGHSRDLTQIKSFLSGHGFIGLLDLPFTPFFILLVFLLSPTLGWIVLIGCIALLTICLLGELTTRQRRIDLQVSGQRANRFTAQIAADAQKPKANAAESGYLKRWLSLHAAENEHRRAFLDRTNEYAVIGRFLRMGLHIGLLSAAAGLVINGAITPGILIAASIIAARAFAPIEKFHDVWRGTVEALAAYARLAWATRSIAPVEDDHITKDDPLDIAELSWCPNERYKPAFSDLSLSVKPGAMVGITGQSGSGKSVLASCIAGTLDPTKGVVRLGALTTTHSKNQQRIAYVTPDITFPSGTIAELISGFGDGSFADVLRAARLAGADEAIKALPNGYATELNGAPLARSLVQRISLARAYLVKPALLVLDEPYTFLDNVGVTHLMQAIAELRSEGCIVVIVAQRPSILSACDKIVVLGNGTGRVLDHQPKPELRLLKPDEASSNPVEANLFTAMAE
jgi:ABC-type protease/lipase transport system fused ATPase/permease subunit